MFPTVYEKNMSNPRKVWLVTGASSGLGLSIAQAAVAAGDIVVAAARRIDRLQAFAQSAPSGQVVPIQLDVTDAASRIAAVDAVIKQFGRIDVLVNNAGRGCNGAVEEVTLDQARAVFELNFFAAVELTRSALPHMRARRAGHVINITSICGLVSLSDLGVYCASKFALEAWTQALEGEVKSLGIRTTLVEPGAFRTEFEGPAIVRPAQRIEDYVPIIADVEARLAGNAGQQTGDPDKAAQVIVEAVQDPAAPLHLVLGADAYALLDAAQEKLAVDTGHWRARGLATAFAA